MTTKMLSPSDLTKFFQFPFGCYLIHSGYGNLSQFPLKFTQEELQHVLKARGSIEANDDKLIEPSSNQHEHQTDSNLHKQRKKGQPRLIRARFLKRRGGSKTAQKKRMIR